MSDENEELEQEEVIEEQPLEDIESLETYPSGYIEEEQEEPEAPKQRFGEKEYNAAKGENGKYNKNYYDDKQKELDKKVEDAKAEKQKNYKKTDDKPIQADGSNTRRKNRFDKVKDDVNLLKAKNDRFNNKINKIKANTFRATHPIENAKNQLKEQAKEKGKQVAKKAAKAAGKAAKEGAKKIGAAILKFLLSNPYVLLVLGIILLIILIIFLIMGQDSKDKESMMFNPACNFNLTTVVVSNCSSGDSSTTNLEDYVKNVAYKISYGRNLSDESLKALMVIVKTNALVVGNYNNVSKSVNINDCDISSLYNTTGDIIDTSSGSKNFWWPVGSDSPTSGNIYGGTPYDTKRSDRPNGISSGFGPRNTGIEGASTDHKGIDIPVPEGTKVIASKDGEVIEIVDGCQNSSCGLRGNYIKIRHSDGIVTIYQHLKSVSVTNHQKVKQGELIAYSGATSSIKNMGAHLHFEVLVNNTPVNPTIYVSISNPRPVSSTINTTDNTTEDSASEELSEKINKLYEKIANYIYVDSSLKGTISDLSTSSQLVIDVNTLEDLQNSNSILTVVLKRLYGDGYALYDLDKNCDKIDSSSFGLGGYPYIELNNPCKNIYVFNTPNGEDGTYPLEEYIAGVVSAEVGVYKNDTMYEIAAIAARTYALGRMQNGTDCSIIGTEAAQVFNKTTNEQIINAVNNTRGLVLTRNGSLISTEYDAFCWDTKDSVYYYLCQKDSRTGQPVKVPITWANEYVKKFTGQAFLNNPRYRSHGRGMSQDGAYYLATEQNMNSNDILKLFYGTDTSLMSIYKTYTFGGNFEFNPSKYDSLPILKNKSLSTFLAEKGSSVEALNDLISQAAISGGIGTRQASINVAMTLLETMANYGYKLPYEWGGKHYTTGVKGSWGGGPNDTKCHLCMGSDCRNTNHANSCNNGLDCSGFVNWVLANALNVSSYSELQNRNAMQVISSPPSAAQIVSLNANTAVCQPGDVLTRYVNGAGHIVLIVGIDEASKNYIVAEASGQSRGIRLTNYSFNKQNYYCRKLDYLYK